MNKTNISDKFKKYWFILAIILTAVVKQLLVINIPINAVPEAACDDMLLMRWATTILGGQWTGPFDCYTFIKEVGYSIFLACVSKSHISVIYMQTFLYTLAIIILVTALKRVVHSKPILFCMYLILLFNPVTFDVQILQRVYRNGIAVAVTVWMFGSLLHLYFSILDKKIIRPIFWSCMTAGSLGYLWILKADTIWVMPFTVVVLLVMAGILLVKNRHLRSIPRYLLVLIPIIGIYVCTSFVSFMNMRTYGADGLMYYGLAMNDMQGAVSADVTESDKVTLSVKTFKRLCEVSPTLAQTKKSVLRYMKKYNKYDTNPSDGDVDSGWLGWALIDGFYDAGFYTDAVSANAFYQKVYEELEAAYASGEIERKPVMSTMERYCMTKASDRKLLVGNVKEAIQYTASFQDVHASAEYHESEAYGGVAMFENMTHSFTTTILGEADYLCDGWLYLPDLDMDKITVYLEDEENNKCEQVKFLKSPDVAEQVGSEAGAKSRFVLKWDEISESDEFHFAIYEGEALLGNVQIDGMSYIADEGLNAMGNLDCFFDNKRMQAKLGDVDAAVARLNVIADVYKAIGIPLFIASLIAYVLFTITFVQDLFKKRYEDVNAWLITTGFGLSILILFVGIAVTNIRDISSIHVMYLSSAYPFLLVIEMLSLEKCVTRIAGYIRKRRGK